MTNLSFKYGDTTISYSLSFAARKTLGIKVYPDKSVKVIAPLDTAIEKVEDKLHSKAAWIIRQQDFFLSFHPLTPPRRFISGETHRYLGKQYRLKVIEGKKESVKLQGGNITVTTKEKNNSSCIENQLKLWYKNKADYHFKQLFDESVPLIASLYKGNPTLKYRWMDKRWGSCSRKGEILLNLELIKANKKSIEYVIFHELCHLMHMNHTSEFYALLEKLSPNWRKIKDELERMMV